MTEKRQTSQGYIIRILQHFATKLRNITNFVMLFQAVIFVQTCLDQNFTQKGKGLLLASLRVYFCALKVERTEKRAKRSVSHGLLFHQWNVIYTKNGVSQSKSCKSRMYLFNISTDTVFHFFVYQVIE
jgi:hypothetical protein